MVSVWLKSNYSELETIDFIETRMLAREGFSVWAGLTWLDVCFASKSGHLYSYNRQSHLFLL